MQHPTTMLHRQHVPGLTATYISLVSFELPILVTVVRLLCTCQCHTNCLPLSQLRYVLYW